MSPGLMGNTGLCGRNGRALPYDRDIRAKGRMRLKPGPSPRKPGSERLIGDCDPRHRHPLADQVCNRKLLLCPELGPDILKDA